MSSCLSCRALHALAAALLRAVQVGLGALGVAGLRDRDDHVLDRDQVLVGRRRRRRRRSGCAARRRTSSTISQSSSRTICRCRSGPGEDVLVGRRSRARSRPARRRSSAARGRRAGAAACPGSPAPGSRRSSSSSIRPDAGDVDGLRRPDQRDDLVERVERLDQTAQDVGPLLGLAQPVAGAPDDDLDLVAHVVPDRPGRAAACAARRRRSRAC